MPHMYCRCLERAGRWTLDSRVDCLLETGVSISRQEKGSRRKEERSGTWFATRDFGTLYYQDRRPLYCATESHRTVSSGLFLGSQGWVDSDFAADPDTRKSMTGYLFSLNGGAVSWRSSRQGDVTLSSAEAEFVAASQAGQEAIYLRALLRGFNLRH